MKYPVLNRKQRQSVVVPVLNGGLNLRDSVSNVNDNQLTDCNNLWFKDGMLRTRPGLNASQVTEDANNSGMKVQKHHVFSENGQLFSALTDEASDTWIDFYWSKGSQYDIPRLVLADGEGIGGVTYFVVQQNTKIYCFVSPLCNIYCLDISDPTEIEWEHVSQQDYYIPTIVMNCLSTYSSIGYELLDSTKATHIEGYSLLTNYYKMIYSTGNPNMSSVVYFPFLLPIAEDIIVTVKYTNRSGVTYTHTMFTDSELSQYYEETDPGDGMRLGGHQQGFWFSVPGTGYKEFTPSDYIRNNMEVTAAYRQDASEKIKNESKVFRMTLNEWFGGGNAGYNGGTRLFLSGNDVPDEKNLVIWSGLNNPLYFDENCYFYVGTDATPVTAFGKQSDMLVIFKQNETYYMQYAQNDDITAADLINQNVVDYQANAVFFPLTLINSTIGCDCPGTVQLCRNRLTWLTSEGKVYSFVVANVYNERTIYEVGEMVYNDLRKYGAEELQNATSADWQEYYLISVVDSLTGKTNTFVMDYNSSGYQYPYSYGKSEDANKSIPWYRWTFDILDASEMISYDGDLCILYDRKNAALKHEVWKADVSRELDTDAGSLIPVMLQTKIFDFLQGYRKDVNSVVFSVGNNGGYPLEIHYVTDAGTEYDEIEIDSEQTDPHDLGFLTDFPMYPCIKSVLRFGVRIECKAATTFNSLRITYKILGGAK